MALPMLRQWGRPGGGAGALPGVAVAWLDSRGPGRDRGVRAPARPGKLHFRAVSAASGASPPWALESVVDLDAFPLHDPASAQAQAVVAGCQQRMRADGYCVLRRFLRPAAAAAAVDEVRDREIACFVQSRRVNMWGENPQLHGNLPPASLRRMSAPDMYGA